MDKREISERNMPTVKLSDIKKMVSSIEQNVNEENLALSFEFILIALFPDCWNNIQAELNRQYTLGYIAGIKENQNQDNNYIENSDDVDCYCE